MIPPLISTALLATELHRSQPPALLDVRWSLGGPRGSEDYRRGHLPGAHFVDLDTELAGPPGPGRHPMPSPAVFEAAMRRAGVSAGSQVVVYDAATGMAAARAWWLLRYFGHDEVQLLDGGYAAWVEEGRPVTSAVPAPGAGRFQAEPGHMPLLDAAGAAAVAARGVLLDARAAERFRGQVEPVDPVAGHIPGARSLPTTGNLDSSGRHLPPEVLRARFAATGAVPGAEVAAYCGSGVTAAHEVLALAAAGIDAGLYVGSWSDWITDPGRPVATGSG